MAQKLRVSNPRCLAKYDEMKRGLVFGKFLPLHRGHQLMIETALSQVDDLTIVVYDSHRPDDDRMPIELRLALAAGAVPERREHPRARRSARDAARHGRSRLRRGVRRGVAFLGRSTSVFSSERGYERFAELLGAEHVLVDEARTLVPTSGTVIRSDPYAYRGWLDPARLLVADRARRLRRHRVHRQVDARTPDGGGARHALDARVRPRALGGAGAARDRSPTT